MMLATVGSSPKARGCSSLFKRISFTDLSAVDSSGIDGSRDISLVKE